MKISPTVNLLSSILLLAALLFHTSCENDVGPIIIEPIDPTTVSFSSEIQPIFDANCSGCHDEFHQFLDLNGCCSYDQLLTDGANAPYVDIETPDQSRLYLHLTGDLLLMPLFGPLPQHEIDLVLKWVEEGALNN